MQYIRLKLTIVRGKLNNDSSFSFTDSDTHKKVIEEAIAKENNQCSSWSNLAWIPLRWHLQPLR